MDEYDSYAAEVYDLLTAGAARHKIAEYLRDVEKQQMEIRGRADADAVAEKLRLVFRASREQGQPTEP